MTNMDPIVVVVRCHRLNFLGPYCEEVGVRLGRDWMGRYYGNRTESEDDDNHNVIEYSALQRTQNPP